MALPKLNNPTYELTLPSTDEVIKYRPFLVKEEKILLIAQDSKDAKQISQAIIQVLNNCILNEKNINDLPTFDIEYIFLNVRAKSIGETIKIKVKAPDDKDTYVETEIDLTKIDVHVDDDHTNKIQLTEDMGMIMTYPKMNTFSDLEKLETNDYDSILAVTGKCIQQIYNGKDTVYDAEDVSDKEKIEFLENLTQEQFLKVQKFFTTMPRLKHEVKVKNPKTKKESKVVLEGLRSFF